MSPTALSALPHPTSHPTAVLHPAPPATICTTARCSAPAVSALGSSPIATCHDCELPLLDQLVDAGYRVRLLPA